MPIIDILYYIFDQKYTRRHGLHVQNDYFRDTSMEMVKKLPWILIENYAKIASENALKTVKLYHFKYNRYLFINLSYYYGYTNSNLQTLEKFLE